VTEGGMRYRCGEKEQGLRAGDSLTFAAGLPHGPVSLIGESVTFLTVVSRLKDS
jgi:quercetin dioxygenase-like cupin family protein